MPFPHYTLSTVTSMYFVSEEHSRRVRAGGVSYSPLRLGLKPYLSPGLSCPPMQWDQGNLPSLHLRWSETTGLQAG